MTPTVARQILAVVEAATPTFSVVLADPPWAYRNFADTAHGAAIAVYDTMPPEAIAAIPVATWAAPDCVLFCWATWPKLDEAMRLVDAWGFEYITAIPWVKTVPSSGEIYRGIGFWTMAASEVLLIGRRGEPKRSGRGRSGDSGTNDAQIGLLTGEDPRVEVHEWIEALFPGRPYLELFARRERPGWTTWGTDLGFRLSAAGVATCERPVEAMPLFDTRTPWSAATERSSAFGQPNRRSWTPSRRALARATRSRSRGPCARSARVTGTAGCASAGCSGAGRAGGARARGWRKMFVSTGVTQTATGGSDAPMSDCLLCEREAWARGLCTRCTSRCTRAGTLNAVALPSKHDAPKLPCSVIGCDRAVEGRGLCRKHYDAARHTARAVGGWAVPDPDEPPEAAQQAILWEILRAHAEKRARAKAGIVDGEYAEREAVA